MKANPELLDYIKIMPQRSFNSYVKELSKYKTSIYNQGDFIIHFPSARGDKFKNLTNKYTSQIINDVDMASFQHFNEVK